MTDPATTAAKPRGPTWLRLGVQVRNPGTLQVRDHVLDHELALLQAPQHDLVDIGIGRQPGDYLVQVLVLYSQLLQPRHVLECVSFYFVCHYSTNLHRAEPVPPEVADRQEMRVQKAILRVVPERLAR